MSIYKKLFEVKKEGIKLQRDTEGYGYKYATLSQIQDKLSEIFIKQKLLITHSIIDNKVKTTIIDLESDEKVESEILLALGTKPQDKGSEITYYRRYNLLSLLDLEVEDDDGAKAQGNTNKKQSSFKGGKTDMMDYIQRIKEETDVNVLSPIYKEAEKEGYSEKQMTWIIKECKERKEYLLANQ